ncbi:MAG: diaminopimelate epimerase [Woeseiaceae bacterium]
MPESKPSGGEWPGRGPAGRAFVKMHGARNHCVIVDARREPFQRPPAEIVRICDVRVGVGADQLVVIETGGNDAIAASLRFYNVDGMEAEACGNATRCVAWLLLEERGADALELRTRNGVLECRRTGERRVSCGMGELSMDWRRIPLAEARDTCHLGITSGPLEDPVAVSVGNPHAVFFVDDLDAIDLARYAPPVQSHALFPRQANVGAAQLIAHDRLRLAVYERGAGLTMACGSGACAAVYAALARGLTDTRRITVQMPGGEVEIEIMADGHAVMTGAVEYCFSGFL